MRRAHLAAASSVFVDVIMKDLAFLMSCPAALPGFSEAQRYQRALCACRRMFLSGCSTPMGLAAVLWADESALAFEFALIMLKEEQNPLLDKETYKAVEFDRAKADSCNASVVKPGAAKWGQRSKMGHGLTGGDTFLVCHISVWDRAQGPAPTLPAQLLGIIPGHARAQGGHAV